MNENKEKQSSNKATEIFELHKEYLVNLGFKVLRTSSVNDSAYERDDFYYTAYFVCLKYLDLKKENKVNEKYSEKQFLKMMMVQETQNLFRKLNSNKRKITSKTLKETDFYMYSKDESDLEREVSEKDLKAYLSKKCIKYLETLSEEKQEIWKLYISGIKYKEIAKRMNLPISKITNVLYLVKKNLKKINVI